MGNGGFSSCIATYIIQNVPKVAHTLAAANIVTGSEATMTRRNPDNTNC